MFPRCCIFAEPAHKASSSWFHVSGNKCRCSCVHAHLIKRMMLTTSGFPQSGSSQWTAIMCCALSKNRVFCLLSTEVTSCPFCSVSRTLSVGSKYQYCRTCMRICKCVQYAICLATHVGRAMQLFCVHNGPLLIAAISLFTTRV